MAEDYKKVVLNSYEDKMNEKLRRLNDYQLSIAIRDCIENAIVENGVYYDLDDINNAINRIYPMISTIIFNSNFIDIRRSYTLFYDIITFLVIRLA